MAEVSGSPAPEKPRFGGMPGWRSISVIGAIFSSIVVAATIAIFALAMLNYLKTASFREMESRARVVAASIESAIAQDMALEDQFAVVEKCGKILADGNGELKYIVVAQRGQDAIVHDLKGWRVEKGVGQWGKYHLLGFENAKVIPGAGKGGSGGTLHFCGPANYMTLGLGWVHVGLSMAPFEQDMANLNRRIWTLALLALVIGVAASALFTRQLTKPIGELHQFAQQLATGDLDKRVEPKGADELVQLGKAMNWMSGKLAESRDELSESIQQKASLREKEILLREIHHRVKNNMQILASLIRIQCRMVDSDQLKRVLVECETRIRSMALLHQKLYQSKSISEIAFRDYVEVLVAELRRLYAATASGVRVEVEIDKDFQLGLDSALPCGLIINELVSNSLKYGFPDGAKGRVCISVTGVNDDEGSFSLNVADDGVGMPEDFDFETARSLGLRLVKMLTGQLHGELKLSGEGGTRFEIHLQRLHYKERVSAV